MTQECSFDFLQRKLLGGSAVVAPEVSMGVVLCRVAAFVCPRHTLAVDLVANHMTTLLACDKEQRGILSTYEMAKAGHFRVCREAVARNRALKVWATLGCNLPSYQGLSGVSAREYEGR